MCTSSISRFNVKDFVQRIETTSEDLDAANATILRLMGKLGPRNLLDVARKSGLPASTVYNRVKILEMKYAPLTYANPSLSKLGLSRTIVFAQAKPGRERIASEALTIPRYWRAVANAEGGFTHYSVQAVPYVHLSKFRKYLNQLVRDGLLVRYRETPTSDVRMNFPNFNYFDSKKRFWTFNWKLWLRKVVRTSARRHHEEPEKYDVQADKTDLIILREMEKDGRRKFAQISKVVGITLQAIKFRYDRRIKPRGLITNHGYNFLTFPADVSDARELQVDFRSSNAMNAFAVATQGVPFISSFAKVLRQNSLILGTYLPNSESANMFAFFSTLASDGLITEYSSVRLHIPSLRRQTLVPELFDKEVGWNYDSDAHLKQLHRLLAEPPNPFAK